MKTRQFASVYNKALLTTTALVGIALAAPAWADNIMPTNGTDTTRNTSTTTTGYTVQAGNDNNVNTGSTTAFIMDGTALQQNLTINSPVVVTSGIADTVSITSGNNPTITIDSGATLSNTGIGSDAIHAGAINVGTANINVNGLLSATSGSGSQAIDFGSVTGGTTNVNLNTTAAGGGITGDILLGLGTNTINISGNGTNTIAGNITTNSGATNSFNVNLGSGTNNFTMGGTIGLNAGAVNILQGGLTATNSVTGGSTVLGANGASALTVSGGTYNAGNITSAAGSANNKTININGGTLSNNINLSAGTGTNAINFNGGTFTGNITGGTAATDTVAFNLATPTTTQTYNGTITGVETLNVTQGAITLGQNLAGLTTANIASTGSLNATGLTSIATSGNLNVNGGLTVASTTILNTSVSLNSTTGTITGPVQLGAGGYAIGILGDGTHALTNTITGGAGADSLNVNLGTAGNIIATGGAIDLAGGANAINIQQGTLSSGFNVNTSGGGTTTTTLGANGNAGLTLTGGTYNAGNITAAANASTHTISLQSGTLANNINFSGSTGSNNFTAEAGSIFNGTYTGGAGTDNLGLGTTDLAGAIDGGAGADSVGFTAGTHTNTLTNIESLALFNSGTTYTNSTAITGLDTALILGAGTTLTANNNISGTGTQFALNGTANVGATNTIALGAGGSLSGSTGLYGVNVNGPTNASSITLTNNVTAQNLAGLTIGVTNNSNAFVANNTQYTIVNNSGTSGLTIPTAAVTDNSFVYDYALSAGGTNANDLILTALRTNGFETTGSNSQNTATGNALYSYAVTASNGGTRNAQLDTIVTNLDNMTSRSQMDRAVETLTPATSGISQVSVDGMTAAQDTIEQQLHRPSAHTGLNTGDGSGYLEGVWVQGFGNFINQTNHDNTPGYIANTYGGSFGMDTDKIIKDGLAGVAFTYAKSDVNSDSLNRADTNIDSYQMTLYGTKTLSPRYYGIFVDGLASAAYNNYDESRNIAVGSFTANPNGSYDGYQGSARIQVGKDLNVVRPGLFLTPEVSAQYTYLHVNGYTETGAGGASLHVGDDDIDSLLFTAGGRLAYNMKYNNASITPELRAKVTYDPIGDEISTTNNFTGGGPAFSTQGIRNEELGVDLGAGVKVLNLLDNVQLTADYDVELKEDYVGQTVQARLRVDF